MQTADIIPHNSESLEQRDYDQCTAGPVQAQEVAESSEVGEEDSRRSRRNASIRGVRFRVPAGSHFASSAPYVASGGSNGRLDGFFVSRLPHPIPMAG